MRELNTVKKFAKTAPELHKMFSDYANQYRTEMGVKGLTFDTSMSKAEKEEAINKCFAEVLSQKSKVTADEFNNVVEFANSSVVREFADSIMNSLIDMILPEALIPSLGMIAEFKFGGYNDSFSFKVKNNALYTVSAAGQRQRTAPAQILRDTTLTLTPYNHMVTVEVNLPDVLSGRTMLAPEIMKSAVSVEAQIRNEALDAFTTVMAGANVPSGLKVQNYTEKSLITLCQKVTAWNQGRKAVIVGTPVALKSVLPSEVATRILLSDGYVTAGYLPVFNTYDVIALDQVADYTSTTYGLKLDDTKLYVISPASDKIVKVAVGETFQHTDAVYDNANLSQSATINKAWATAVITNSVCGIVNL